MPGAACLHRVIQRGSVIGVIGPSFVLPEAQGTSRLREAEWWLYETDMSADITIARCMELA